MVQAPAILLGAVLLGAPGTVEYGRDVKPVLARRCAACHGALKQAGGLRLDTAAAIRAGGASGPAVEPGAAAESLLIEAVTGAGALTMPPEGAPLTAAEIDALRAWIDAGATGPADEPPQADPAAHWAFRAPTRPAVPVAAGGRNPIDAFLAAERDRRGLVPLPEADRATLLRRAALDLTGLAPTPAEVAAFAADPAPDAYERAIDRLLASPAYGERWGRHWLDIWRYSDWAGYNAEVRESQPHIWRWRDWAVASLNADIGYDAMLRAMLAGDELAPGDPATLRATGYLVRNWAKFSRDAWLQGTVDHTARAFLGLTLACARCHDHKYDPIPQADWYRMRAVFEPHDVATDPVPGQPDTKKDGLVRAFDAKPDAPTYLFRRGNEKDPDTSRTLAPGVPAVLGGPLAIEPVPVAPVPERPATSTGRRLALARWITDRANPLTARVAVNHVWMRHFGEPIVPTVFDFGLNGKPPSHPALLDWLAVEFMESGWSLKHLHRLIVTSAAYRMQSAAPAGHPNARLDPANRFLWRMNSRRMEAELVRDNVLHVAGTLDTTLGGPDLDPNAGLTLPRRSLYFRHASEKQVLFLKLFDAANVAACYRRDVSVVPQQALALLNSPLALSQARVLAGSLEGPDDAFVAAAFAHVLGRGPTSEEQSACLEFLAAQAARLADSHALTPSPDAPAPAVPPAADPHRRARENLVHVLFNHHDFVTIR